jgi:hypothetical protein
MYHCVFSHVEKWDKDLDCKASSEANRDSIKIVQSKEIIEVDAQHFKGNTLKGLIFQIYKMFSEDKIFLHPDYVFSIFPIIVFEVIQDADFYHALFVKSLFVSDYFKCHKLLLFVVKCFQHLNLNCKGLPHQRTPFLVFWLVRICIRYGHAFHKGNPHYLYQNYYLLFLLWDYTPQVTFSQVDWGNRPFHNPVILLFRNLKGTDLNSLKHLYCS